MDLTNAIVLKTLIAHYLKYYASIIIVPAQTFHASNFNPFLQLSNFHHSSWEERAELTCGQSIRGMIDKKEFDKTEFSVEPEFGLGTKWMEGVRTGEGSTIILWVVAAPLTYRYVKRERVRNPPIF
jgi:hypothetical protein